MDKNLIRNMERECSGVRLRKLQLPLPPIDRSIVGAIGAIEAVILDLAVQIAVLETHISSITARLAESE